MTDPADPTELDAALTRMRLAVLAASFRKLRYRIAPEDLASLLADRKTNSQAFDHVESLQPLLTKMRIRWNRLRHGDKRER